jgi:hypothetical protein
LGDGEALLHLCPRGRGASEAWFPLIRKYCEVAFMAKGREKVTDAFIRPSMPQFCLKRKSPFRLEKNFRGDGGEPFCPEMAWIYICSEICCDSHFF